MSARQTEEDCVMWLKATEQLLNGPWGVAILSTAVFKVKKELWH